MPTKYMPADGQKILISIKYAEYTEGYFDVLLTIKNIILKQTNK
jgi:hypothetical protein